MTSGQQLWGAFTTTVAGEVSNGGGGPRVHYAPGIH